MSKKLLTQWAVERINEGAITKPQFQVPPSLQFRSVSRSWVETIQYHATTCGCRWHWNYPFYHPSNKTTWSSVFLFELACRVFFLRIFETWDPANWNMLAVSWLVYVYIYKYTSSPIKIEKLTKKKHFRNQSVYRVFWESSSLKPKTISRAPLLWAGLQWTDAVPWLWKNVTHPPVIKHGNGSPPIFIHSHIICRWCSDENKEISHSSRC